MTTQSDHKTGSQTVAYLPPALLPELQTDLIRLGPGADGGYLITQRSVEEAQVLVSFGISNNWIFESDFLAMNRTPCVAYDDTTGPLLFFKEFLKTCFYVAIRRAPAMFIPRSLAAYSRYKAFFTGDVRHIKQRIGPKTAGMTDLTEVLAPFDDGKTVFLKVDIEGSEYDILDQIAAVSDRLSGLAIEFHDVPDHLPRILDFVDRFDLEIVHAHANNYTGVDGDGCPLAIELSFTAKPDGTDGTPDLPHPLDRPNDGGAPELPLRPQPNRA